MVLRELLTSCLGNDQQIHVQQKLPKDGCDVLGREAKWEMPKREM